MNSGQVFRAMLDQPRWLWCKSSLCSVTSFITAGLSVALMGCGNWEAAQAQQSASSSLVASADAPGAQASNEEKAGGDAFPELYNSEPETAGWMSPAEALSNLSVPEGFEATLFAAEPEVQNPIAQWVDARGRVWVAENYTYAERSQRFDLSLNDRVVVLEDTNGDGRSDKRTVFADNLKMLTGITVGRGGVWVMCPPQLLFIPDADDDLVPDGPAVAQLDGFHVATENYHNFANGLSWGPDNWLYGRCGASCAGEMGLPGAADDQRVPIRGGIWRFHPEHKIVEALNQGTTNPWGHDWNERGDLFFINTVNGHLWHSIPGAHYVRPHTIDANPYSYQQIDMHADHWHFDTGKRWEDSRDGAANDFGGGHAHIGMMIYLERQWPEAYQGNLLTINMHGRRVNQERLQRVGSGYVGSHGQDVFYAGDTWFRGMEISPMPDGSVLLADWSDTGECHDHTGVHRTSGRLFQIHYRGKPINPHPLADSEIRTSPLELAWLQQSGSNWTARRAREMMAQLYRSGAKMGSAIEPLRSLLSSGSLGDQVVTVEGLGNTKLRLRALWSLVALEAVDQSLLTQLLDDTDPVLRDWAVRLLSDTWPLDMVDGRRPGTALGDGGLSSAPEPSVLDRLVQLARQEPDAAVRLTLASTLQRLPLETRAAMASALLSHESDWDDHNLPLMVWYGVMPLGEQHVDDLVAVARSCRWPLTLELISRRIADQVESQPQAVESLLKFAKDQDATFLANVVRGLAAALEGRQRVAEPASWPAVRERLQTAGGDADSKLRGAVQTLSILFGDGRTVDELKLIAADRSAALELRRTALQTLVDSRADGLQLLCMDLLSERFLNTTAARGLARETDSGIGSALVDAYRRFHPSERSEVVSILSTRVPWAEALLRAVKAGRIEPAAISAFQARQMASLESERVDALLGETWGQVRSSSADIRALIERLRSDLTVENLAAADPRAGRELFTKSCSSCHKLYGVGGDLGPDLTGAQRSNLDYLLENIADPSAVVTTEFRATVLLLEDGRVLTGLLTSQTDNDISLATQDRVYRIPAADIVEQKLSTLSTMPEGLLQQLTAKQIRDLFAYLQSSSQVEK